MDVARERIRFAADDCGFSNLGGPFRSNLERGPRFLRGRRRFGRFFTRGAGEKHRGRQRDQTAETRAQLFLHDNDSPEVTFAEGVRKWRKIGNLRLTRNNGIASFANMRRSIHSFVQIRSLITVLGLIFVAQSLFAQDWAKPRLEKSPRHGEWVSFKSGERTIKAFVVYPESKTKTPVVLVIHEIFGLTDWVRGVCDQLAENGVIAIAPDLLSGQTFSDVDGARKAISELPKEQVKADFNATAEYALKIPAANGTLAVCGFCWGGGWAFAYANENPQLKAAYSILWTRAGRYRGD